MRPHYCTAHTRKLKLDSMKDDLTWHRFISQTSLSPALAEDVYCECSLLSIRPAARLTALIFNIQRRCAAKQMLLDFTCTSSTNQSSSESQKEKKAPSKMVAMFWYLREDEMKDSTILWKAAAKIIQWHKPAWARQDLPFCLYLKRLGCHLTPGSSPALLSQ